MTTPDVKCFGCPVAADCLGTIDALNGLQDSLLHQQRLLAEAAKHAQAADLAEGLAILAGELTAEQSEEIRRQHREEMARDPTLANTEELPARRAEADERLVAVRIDLAQAGDGLTGLHKAQETCKGPKLSLIGRIALGIERFRDHKLPSRLNEANAYFYIRYGRCSSHAAKAALRSMPKLMN